MLLYLIIMLAYLTVGAVYSRHRYADKMLDPTLYEMRREIEEKRSAVVAKWDSTGVHHSLGCASHQFTTKEYRTRHCSCDAIKKKQVFDEQLRALPQTPNVWLPMVAWPVYGIESFLKGGTSKKYNPALTARLEKELLELD